MAIRQAELALPLAREEHEESEQARELRMHGILLRKMEEAAAEVGRERICYALNLAESTLSRQLREVEDKRPSYKLLAYLLKHEQSGRLARWVMADYAGYVPPSRPERLRPEDFARQIAAMALGGEFGAGERAKVLDLYGRVSMPREEE